MSRFIMPRQGVNGQNLSPGDGALLYFYIVGTTTLKSTYTNAAKSIASTNPVVADATGLFAYIEIDGAYDVVLKDKNGVQLWGPETIQELVDSSEDTAIQELTTATMAANTKRTYLVGDVVQTKEWATGYGVDGGATYDVALTSAVTPNTYDVIIGTADALISFVLRVRGVLNVKQMSAAGDGSVDDTAAIQAVFDYANTNGSPIYFPHGQFSITNVITKDFKTNNNDITIFGDSDATSQILISGGNGGFDLEMDDDTSLNLSKIWFRPVGTAQGTAFKCLSTGTSSNIYLAHRIENCSFGHTSGANSASNYFGVCLEIGGTTDVNGSGVVSSCYFNGVNVTDPTQTVGLLLRFANDIVYENNQAYNLAVGIKIDSELLEGLIVQNSYLIRNKICIYAHQASINLPMVNVSNCHLSYTKTGIDILNYAKVNCNNNLFLCREDSTEVTTIDILSEASSTSSYTNNTFAGEATTATEQRTFSFNGSGTLNTVEGNKASQRDSLIYIQASGGLKLDNSRFTNNLGFNMLTANGHYDLQNDCIGLEFQGRYDEFMNTATISSPQVIATATWTVIEWANFACEYDGFKFVATATPGEMTIKNGQGGMVFDINIDIGDTSAGARVMLRVMNGLTEVARSVGAGNTAGYYLLHTNLINCAAADIFTVEVYQDTGSNATIATLTTATVLKAYMR